MASKTALKSGLQRINSNSHIFLEKQCAGFKIRQNAKLKTNKDP
jgi:hypothetical protein